MGNIMDVGVLLAKGILLILSVLSVAVIGERLWTLRRARRAEDTDYAALRETLSLSAKPALDVAQLHQETAGSHAPSLRALAAGLEQTRGGAPVSSDRFRESVGMGIAMQTARLQDNLSLLGTVASTAPYIGLFGTVLGILSAFRHIARTGDTGAAAVAGGISEALITTALGLGVAVPAVMAYNYFAKRTADFGLLVEAHALELAGRVADHAGKDNEAA